MKETIRRWYSRSIECVSEEIFINEAARSLASSIMSEVESREYKLDVDNPITKEHIALSSGLSEVTVSIGVILTSEQDLEWDIEECLKEIIRLDDRLDLGWHEDPDRDLFSDPEIWREKLNQQIDALNCRLNTLRISRGWK